MLLDSSRILVMDGAMGTLIQRLSLAEADFRGDVFTTQGRELKGNNECLNLTRPDVIADIHRQYIMAGADIIETNTFGANRITQSEYGCEGFARRMALEGARIARAVADGSSRKIYVAGSVSPTGRSLSLASDVNRPASRLVSFDEMADAYAEQISALAEGGVDFILAETAFDALNVKAAIYALERVAPHLPMMISVAVSDKSGRSLTGQTIEAFYTAVKHAPLLAFGLNCGFGASDLESLLESFAPYVDCPVSFYPNAGLPNEMGQYDQSPEDMASQIESIARKGLLNIVGGCCGTTPDHIRAVASAVAGIAPRAVPVESVTVARLTVSGLENTTIDKNENNLTNVGERTNVAGSRKFARLIASGAYEDALQVAADQIEGGASIIDINMDDAMLDSTVEMEKFLRYISNDPAVSKAALMIDSSHFETVVAGLKNAMGKCIVNSISLKEGEESFLEKARVIRSLGAAVVVMAFDEEGQATTYDRKIEICSRAYHLLIDKAGFKPCDIIFDVNVLSVGTGIAEHARYGIDFIEAVRWIKSNLPGALTSGGISNLSFAFRGNNRVREAMHSVFLYHATAAGLDMGIVNPSMLVVYDDIEPELLKCVEDVILNSDPDATERLIDKAQRIMESASDAKENSDAASAIVELPVTERLSEALVKCKSVSLKEDVLQALLELGKPVDVIEGPLMKGMERVGELFGAGKMFLPQVVKSAKIMRDAVDILQPFMTDGDSPSTGRPKVVIATVKGDVHDIGKNITSIVLRCNGFDVTDLGVMVPEDTILDTAESIGADIVAASGLITPSLVRMEELCRKMKERGMSIPLFVGGATTSALHTSVKLAPLYDHVYYGSDASASAVLFKRYMMDPDSFEAEEHIQQQKIRDLYESRRIAPVTSEHKHFGPETYLKDRCFADIPCRRLSVEEVLPCFDWRMLYAIWGFKYAGEETEDTAKLREDAQRALDYMKDRNGCDIRIAVRFLDAFSRADDIIADNRGEELVFPMFRQSTGDRLSLSDFVARENGGFKSQMGLFAISVHRCHHAAACDCGRCSGDSYESMLERSVRQVLAEAASSWLDAYLEASLPDGRKDVGFCKPAAGYSSCPDHTLKREILPLLPDYESLAIEFTESYAMVPDASICGFIFAHPQASYPDIRNISDDAISDYSSRRGLSEEESRLFFSHLK